jgi:transposase
MTEAAMEVLYPRCAGLDVHKATVVACARVVTNDGVQTDVRTFSTTTTGLLALADWLAARGCRHVAMEATGVYWKPVWHVLAGDFELVLANAGHVRNVPGRKSDVNDAMWLADLLAHGLLRGSFVPPPAVQELRDLTRTRKQLVRALGQHVQRIEKVLEDANLKVTGVLTDIVGVSGRRMLDALIAGETDPEALAALASPRVKATRAELREALRGRVTAHHRFLLREHVSLIDHLRERIAMFEAQIGTVLEPFRAAADRLVSIPGVSDIAAHVIVAEIGIDMSRFPTVRHLISWAGLCPRMDESAGKRRSTRVRKGAPWLKTVLVQCAWAATRAKGTYLQAQFRRLKARRGAMKATIAVAASILTAAYYMLRDGVPYRDLGPDYFDHRDKTTLALRLARRIRTLGYDVRLEPAAA